MEANNERSMVISQFVAPMQANLYGNMHGGELLSLLDKVAYACSTHYCRQHTVTLAVEQVIFKEPIHIGELIHCYACVNYVGNTSMLVGIKVMARDLVTGNERHTNSCYFTMVAIDKKGKPVKVPTFEPITDEDKRRYENAKARRASR